MVPLVGRPVIPEDCLHPETNLNSKNSCTEIKKVKVQSSVRDARLELIFALWIRCCITDYLSLKAAEEEAARKAQEEAFKRAQEESVRFCCTRFKSLLLILTQV